LAVASGVRTLAFPSISTGAYPFPLERAAEIAIGTVREFLAQSDLAEEVTFVCFDDRTLAAYQRATRPVRE
jgi:O-acetyl-ADP-ribose deacetylase (regulator of RNase III)